jgi:hypothetical protein
MATNTHALPTPSVLSLDRAASKTAAIPWTIWCMAAACTSAIIGAHWDISWHSSIGRDTFFTPAHIAIYLCGVLGGIAAAWLILSHTFKIGNPDSSATVSIFGLRAPLGAFLIAWGGMAMLTSAPFDDWWHNAYGLDVKIISPPHVLLIFGFLTVELGALFLVLGEMNRADAKLRSRLQYLFLYIGGLILINLTILILELTTRTFMHTAFFYRVIALAIPICLATIARSSGHRWGATLTAGVYTVFLLGFQWILPLFPAEPKLGPVYNPVTYFVPPQFPLLLIIPAFALDWFWHRFSHRSNWFQAIGGGALFLATYFCTQYPFATFLMSDAAKNYFWGSIHFGYYVPPTSKLMRGQFYTAFGEETLRGYWLVMAQALLIAILTTRAGLALGAWMRTIQR